MRRVAYPIIRLMQAAPGRHRTRGWDQVELNPLTKYHDTDKVLTAETSQEAIIAE